MHVTRANRMKRLLAALVVGLAVAASGPARLADADPANPFAVGHFDIRNTCGPTPFLSLAITNNGSVASSKSALWYGATLYVAYLRPNGTFYPTIPVALPNIAAQSEQTLKIPVLAADPTYTIAIKATSVTTQQIIPLLHGTVITPSRAYCEAGAPAPPAPRAIPAWAKPCPGNTKCSYAALNTARLNTVDRLALVSGGSRHLKTISGEIGGNFCSNHCQVVGDWLGAWRKSYSSSDFSDTTSSYASPLVGYVHDNQTRTFGDDEWNEYVRTAFSFDLSRIPKGRSIWYATLVLKPQRTMLDYKVSNGTTCGAQIATLNYPWWNNVLDRLDKANYSAAIGLDTGSSPQVSLDITPLARSWAANPSTNFGLALRGDPSEENLGAFLQNSCVTQYNFIQLQVQYAS